MGKLYYAAVGWPHGSWSEALRDSHAEAQAWLREQSARGEPVTTVLTPQRHRTESLQAIQARIAALQHPGRGDWSGPLHAAHLLCAADHRASPELVARRLAELDVEARLVEMALAARIVTTARAYGRSPREALQLDLDDVRWHQHDALETPVPEDVAAEIHELRERARADPAWWASLWRHLNAILHGQLLAGLGGDTRAPSPSTSERVHALDGPCPCSCEQTSQAWFEVRRLSELRGLVVDRRVVPVGE